MKTRAMITMAPVKTPPIGVRTPLLLLMAVLEKLPVPGYALTKDPIRLQMPIAIISCVESKVLPLANAFAIATDSRIDSKAMIGMPEPSSWTMSKKSL
uniref:Uncharacterized protein n=1 Tax=Ixodes ricinus TaxID=34613 RepID=A0A6B0U4T5_IXORI